MKSLAVLSAILLTPVLAFAQSTGQTVDSVQELGSFMILLINNVAVPLIFALAFLFFIWGVFTYFIRGAGDEEARGKGASYMLYAIIGFFVMISVWGLVRILTGSIRLNNATPIETNQLPQASPTKR